MTQKIREELTGAERLTDAMPNSILLSQSAVHLSAPFRITPLR
jgi:hypothetical protein